MNKNNLPQKSACNVYIYPTYSFWAGYDTRSVLRGVLLVFFKQILLAYGVSKKDRRSNNDSL